MKLHRLILSFVAAVLAAGFVTLPASGSVNGTSWPQMLADNTHSSYSTDPAISASSKFGIKWMANIYDAAMGSEAVAYNAALGKTVVYVGTERADLFAIDAATGNILWSVNLGVNDKIESSPLVAPDGSIWISTAQNAALYKLNPANGAIECSAKNSLPILGSFVYADPPGGIPSIFWASTDTPAFEGPIFGSNEQTCAQEWEFLNYARNAASAGAWATPAYAVSKSGEPLIFVGTADSDSTEYAIDANTGARVWYYEALNPNPYTYDIGGAATVSGPGVNGLSDGAVYFASKYGYEYALDMSTGAPFWTFIFAPGTKAQSSRSGAALDGNQLVEGYGGFTGFGGGGGVVNFNAASGAVNWQYTNPDASEVLSSVNVIGAPGSEVVAFGDIAGQFQVLNLANGSQIYDYQTNGYFSASPAEADGTIFIASSNGFLYAFAPNGGSGSQPSAAISTPVNNAALNNPNGSVTVTGTASDASGVTAVQVAVQQSGESGSWYNASNGSYNQAPVTNLATLASPGATSTKWTLKLPIPAAGGNWEIFATPVNKNNLSGQEQTSAFSVKHSSTDPNVIVSETQVSPDGEFTASAKGFAPNETVQFSMFGSIVATATANASGDVPTTSITVGLGLPWQFGPTTLTLTGETSGDTTSVVMDISNDWLDGGDNAMRQSVEPNDQVINKSLSVGNNTVLSESWYYMAGAAVNSSPTFANGVAFIGNDAGTLTAVQVKTGASKWTYTIPTGAAIRSAPAINSLQHVVFSAADGNVYVLNSQTGTLVWSYNVGGTPTSPVSTSGNTIVSSNNGALYDINSNTGALIWKSALSGSSESSPAYDSTSNIVVVGDDSGAITAFKATSGSQLWKVTTGGAVKATPMIANGTVYVGSGDGNLYAITESSGGTQWTFKMSGPIVSNAALYGTSQIAVGDTNGFFEMLTSAGKNFFHINTAAGAPSTSPIVGISTVYSNTFVSLADGEVGMIRTDGPEPFGWSFQTKSTLSTQVAIVDGTAYVGAADGGLYAFTPYAANPMVSTRNGTTISVSDGNNNGWSCSQVQVP